MAEGKKEKTPKADIMKKFRETLHHAKINRKDIEKAVMDGLQSAQSEVRALAAKTGISHFDRAWIKKNVVSLLEKEKSKKVLRVIEKYYDGDKIEKALKRLGLATLKAKPAGPKKKEAPAAAAETAENKAE